MHDSPINLIKNVVPTIIVNLEKEPISIFGLILETRNFTFTPELLCKEYKDRTEHALFHIDGQKILPFY